MRLLIYIEKVGISWRARVPGYPLKEAFADTEADAVRGISIALHAFVSERRAGGQRLPLQPVMPKVLAGHTEWVTV